MSILRSGPGAAPAQIGAVASRPAAAQVSTTDTRLPAQPAVSASRSAFAYAGDLWTAKLVGSDVRRLTTADGNATSWHVSAPQRGRHLSVSCIHGPQHWPFGFRSGLCSW